MRLRGAFSELSSAPFLRPSHAPFQTILHPVPEPPSLPHSQTKPFCSPIMLFNKVHRTLPIPSPLASPTSCPSTPIPPPVCSRAVCQFSASVRPLFLGSVPSHVAVSPPYGTLPTRSPTSTTTEQPPSPLLVSAIQEAFPHLPKSSFGGFPDAPIAHGTSPTRAGHIASMHTVPWLVYGSKHKSTSR